MNLCSRQNSGFRHEKYLGGAIRRYRRLSVSHANGVVVVNSSCTFREKNKKSFLERLEIPRKLEFSMVTSRSGFWKDTIRLPRNDRTRPQAPPWYVVPGQQVVHTARRRLRIIDTLDGLNCVSRRRRRSEKNCRKSAGLLAEK